MSKKVSISVILDTNAIYNSTIKHLLNKKIKDLIKLSATFKDVECSWILPKMVLDERKYQMRKDAFTMLERSKKVDDFFERKILSVDEKKIDRKINQYIRREIKANKIKIISPKVRRINWNALINDSVNRGLPFEKENEKGFRDRLIGETIIEYCKGVGKKKVFILCGDKLLRSFLESNVTKKSVFCHPTLLHLKNDINIIESNAEKGFIDKLVKESKMYFSHGDKSFFKRKGIWEKINKKYENVLSYSGTGIGYIRNNNSSYTYEKTLFIKKELQNVTFETAISRGYELTSLSTVSPFSTSVAPQYPSTRTLWGTSYDVLPSIGKEVFTVKWKCKILDDGSFSDGTFLSLSHVDKAYHFLYEGDS
jgi:hypothetical protein